MVFGCFKKVIDGLWDRYQFIVDKNEVKVNIPDIHMIHNYVDDDDVDWRVDDAYYKVMDAAHSCWTVSLEAMLSKDMSDEEFVALYEGILNNCDLDMVYKVMDYRNNPSTMDYDTKNFWGAPNKCFPNWSLGCLSKYYLDENHFVKKIVYWNA